MNGSDLPPRGTYVLHIPLSIPLQIRRAGRPPDELPPGDYLYVGSAKRALPARVARHLRPHKTLHWHIDRLTLAAAPRQVWIWPAGLECRLAEELGGMPGVCVAARGFGSGDCRCPAHLFGCDDAAGVVRRLERRIPGPVVVGRAVGEHFRACAGTSSREMNVICGRPRKARP